MWHKGRVFDADPYDESTYRTVRDRESIWRAKVKNRNGGIGWSREPKNFGNVDQCG